MSDSRSTNKVAVAACAIVDEEAGRFWVECTCGARGPIVETLKDARPAWNKRLPLEPAEHALLYRFASAVASEEGPDHLDQQAARRWMADDFARTERQQSETKEACQHAGQKEWGPRIEVAHGTFATEVCKDCGWWRTTTHKPGDWQPPPFPENGVAI